MAQVIIQRNDDKQDEINDLQFNCHKLITEAAEEKHLALDFGFIKFNILVFWNKMPVHPRMSLTVIFYIIPGDSMGLCQCFFGLVVVR